MVTVRQTPEFADWLFGLRDRRARARVEVRIDRLSLGHTGDYKSVGDGIGELRIDYGPGYRVYFIRRDDVLVLLLCGGNKSSQSRDIAKAKALARRMED